MIGVKRRRPQKMSQFYVTALKSFGDFVVALRSIEQIKPLGDASKPVLLAGQHLHALAMALGAEQHVRFIGNGSWSDVPAAFDVGRRGKLAAVRSLLELRRELSALGDTDAIMFDRIGWRERFIGGHHRLVDLPRDCDSIYLAYTQLLASMGYAVSYACTAAQTHVQYKAVIVPGSRIARKAVPVQVLARIHSKLKERGIDSTVVRLEGEAVDIPSGMPAITLPRSFDALVGSLKSADLVISADSLSAHLGEYHGRPTFVVTPVGNRYWLPPTAFASGAWALFDNLRSLTPWLDQHTSPASTSSAKCPA